MSSISRRRSLAVAARVFASMLGMLTIALAPAVVHADPGVPDPAHSNVPAFIKLGGTQSQDGVPDPTIAFTVTYRDFLNNPVVGAVVEINLVNCSDLFLCTAVVAGQEADCGARVVRGVTNSDGQTHMTLLGAGANSGTTLPPLIAPGSGSGCIRVFANGIPLATATAVLYDQNGSLPGGNGVNGLDFSIAKNDVGASGLGAPYRGRTDYTADGAISGGDLAALKAVVGASGLGQGSGAGCSAAGGTAPYCP